MAGYVLLGGQRRMKIVMDRKDGATFGGDVIALIRISSFLQNPSKYKDDPVIAMWIGYLKGIENHWAESNYHGTPEKYEFDLPFEEDYKKKIEGKDK